VLKVRARNGRDTYVGPMNKRKRLRLIAKASRKANRRKK